MDVRNKLKTVINFGPLKGARNKVLRRADAVHGFVYDCRDHQVPGSGARNCAVLLVDVYVWPTILRCSHAAARHRNPRIYIVRHVRRVACVA